MAIYQSTSQNENYDALEMEGHDDLYQIAPQPQEYSKLEISWLNRVIFLAIVCLIPLTVYVTSSKSSNVNISSTSQMDDILYYGNLDETQKSNLFLEFVKTHEKDYTESEYTNRFSIFKQNLARVDKLNQDAIAINSDERHGINLFSDLTNDEFKSRYTGVVVIAEEEALDSVHDTITDLTVDNKLVDWRTAGYVTPIRNQVF